MDVRRASGVVDAGRCKKFSELGRKKFASAVAVHETADMRGHLCFAFQEMYGFKTCVIIHENEQVLEAGVLGAHGKDWSAGEAVAVPE
eukprot:4013284-Pleurochrysis_carterae.AAC.1